MWAEAPAVVSGISQSFDWLSRTRRHVTYVLLTRAPVYSGAEAPFLPRLACVRHAASVRSEPGSNSPVEPGSAHPTLPGGPLCTNIGNRMHDKYAVHCAASSKEEAGYCSVFKDQGRTGANLPYTHGALPVSTPPPRSAGSPRYGSGASPTSLVYPGTPESSRGGVPGHRPGGARPSEGFMSSGAGAPTHEKPASNTYALDSMTGRQRVWAAMRARPSGSRSGLGGPAPAPPAPGT